jgi:fatty-acyl-CoA synthase
MRLDVVDRVALEQEGVATPVGAGASRARRLAKLGRPVPGLEVRVVKAGSDETLGDRQVGELEIIGTSVTPGYYRAPEATDAAFHDGWLRTGDLAYLVDGELVLCGRIKDTIIIGGRNIYPEDIERAVGTIEGVRAGNVIAFGVLDRNKEAVVVVAEVRDTDLAAVRRAVHHRVLEAVGIPPKDVVLLAPGSVPKTSSGKLQRSLCRQRYDDGSLIDLASG